MDSIFEPAVNTALIGRINRLTPDTPALWGKMNVSQMLAHCQVPIKMAFGEMAGKGGLMALIFGKMAKKKLVSDKPFERNLPTMNEAKIKSDRGFETEKQALIELVERFTKGPQVIANRKHPFFGPLTIEEWNTLQHKHLDHHLRQFGV